MHFIFLLYEILFYTKYQHTYFKNVCHSLSTKRKICFHSSNNLLLLLQYVHKKIKTTTTQNNKGVKMLQMLYILFKGLILKIDLKDSCSPKNKTKAKKGTKLCATFRKQVWIHESIQILNFGRITSYHCKYALKNTLLSSLKKDRYDIK